MSNRSNTDGQDKILNDIAYSLFKTDYKYIGLDVCKVQVLEQYNSTLQSEVERLRDELAEAKKERIYQAMTDMATRYGQVKKELDDANERQPYGASFEAYHHVLNQLHETLKQVDSLREQAKEQREVLEKINRHTRDDSTYVATKAIIEKYKQPQ